ncbi:cupredoxin domain-containing protein [Salinilacihabitans rarus]|uniref:cupredoxin domain-containing protein n=1 Tax=Salinilacihabitans rarus TaxID=2961596 RepID=UPI0020C833D7|nr:plastocyanin/azurin family copper-binding protein [Salinilacihabitans rarus]
MPRDDTFSRRRVLRYTGIATVTAALAGCTDGGDGDGDGGGPGDGEDNETDENETGDNETEDNETEDNETGDNETEDNETEDNETDGNETEEGDGAAGDVIEPGEIMLEALTENWVGMEPEQIADEENPTLTLTEGETYEITWENGDGAGHNIAIWDDNGEVVEDYETEIVDQEGETQTLEFDVTSEMAQYVCIPHQTTMVGDIEVQ